MAGTKKDFTDHGYCQYSVGALHAVQLFNVAAIGAAQVNTTVQAAFVTPARCKISSVALYASSVEGVAGDHLFNIVVGSGAYAQGTTVQNDNVTLPYYNKAATVPPQQIAGGGSGITTNFAQDGQALFAADVAINAANTPNIGVGGGSAVFGDVPTALAGAVLAASDAVFERGQLITLRFVTPAAVGALTNVLVSAVLEIRPLNWPPSPVQVQPNSPLQGFVTPANAVSGPLQTAPNIANVRPVPGVTF